MRVSLCQTAMMIYREGKIMNLPEDLRLNLAEINALRVETKSHLGDIRHLAPVLDLSITQPYWALPTPELGSSKPIWA